jgi:Lon protease-like protein
VSDTLGLFPLGTTLLPGQLLPLHVFEPRYQELVRDLVQTSFDPASGRPGRRGPRFGVVAIRVGSEVGATTMPQLHAVGCAAEVLEVQHHTDGTSELVAVGRERFELLGLDPTAGTSYLTGRVRWLEEPPGSASRTLASDVRDLFGQYRSIVTIAGRGPFETRADAGDEGDDSSAESGAESGAEPDLEPDPESGLESAPRDRAGGRRIPSDPTVLSWTVAGSMVLHAGERQRLLEDPDAATRLRRLRRLLRRELTLLPLLPSLPTSDLARQPPDPR